MLLGGISGMLLGHLEKNESDRAGLCVCLVCGLDSSHGAGRARGFG